MVNILGFTIGKSQPPDRFQKLHDHYINSEIKKSSMIEAADRPALSTLDCFSYSGIKVPTYPFNPIELYGISRASDLLANILYSLNREVFRNGFSVEAAFDLKCENCGKTTEVDTDEKCDVCGGKLLKPDPAQYIKAMKIMNEPLNINGQTLHNIYSQMKYDVDVIDTMYLLILKEYETDASGEIINSQPVDISAGNTLFLRTIADDSGIPGLSEKGIPVWTCIKHRSVYKESKERPKCPHDHILMHQAYYVAHSPNTTRGIVEDKEPIYYIKDEVIHTSQYQPSLFYGYPRVIPAFRKVLTLLEQDNLIFDWYKRQKQPKSLFLVASKSIESFEKAWSNLLNRTRGNPHITQPMAVETDQKSGQFAQVIKMMDTLDEMQYTETREEMRRTVGAIWGVLPLFMGDASSSGGLNNEGLQITVTTRAIDAGQQPFNTKISPFLLKQFGITDWKIVVNPTEEKDNMSELQVESQKINNAMGMRSLGFDVDLDDNGEFVFTKVEQSQQPQSPSRPDVQEEQQDQNMDGEPESVHRSREILVTKIANKVNEFENTLQTKIYGDRFKKYGDSAEGVCWKSRDVQKKRFEIFLKLFDSKAPEILDVGCGTGAFQQFLKVRNYEPDYKGIDIQHEFIKVCQQKGLQVEKQDATNISGEYDYLVCSGAFNLGGDVKKGIISMWNACKKGIAINLLNKAPSKEYSIYDSNEILRFAKSFDPEAELITGYLDNDFTIIMRKKDVSFDNIIKAELDDLKNNNVITKAEFVPGMIRDIESNIFDSKFEGLSGTTSDKIKTALIKAFREGIPMRRLIKRLQTIAPKMDEAQAESIVRTEMTSIKNTAREYAFKDSDSENKNLYTWISVQDARRTKICERITERTQKGVKLEILKKIVNEESANGMGNNWDTRNWTPHPSCRSVIGRIFD